MSALTVVDAEAIDEHETLPERRPANRKVRLHIARSARAWIKTGHEAQRLDDGGESEPLEIFSSQHGQIAVHAFERNWRNRGRHDDLLNNLRSGRLLRRWWRRLLWCTEQNS